MVCWKDCFQSKVKDGMWRMNMFWGWGKYK
jgi:hypothetical protein